MSQVLISAYLTLVLLLIYVVANPEPHPTLSLTSRNPSPRRVSASPSVPDFDFDVLPYVLISTIDGALHAVDRNDGKVRWSLKDGEPLVGGGGKGNGREEQYIVEPLSGSLFVFDDDETEEGTPKIRKLPLSVEQL